MTATLKYALTGEAKILLGVSLRRIKRHSTGESGGWIESEKNLSQFGDAWVFEDARVSGDARVATP